jgi:putative ABC transport system permease protein
MGWPASSLQDLRHGVVLLRRDPAVSALIVLVLALGIGGNTAIFTLLKAAFVDPLPYRDADRLVTVIENNGWNASVSEFIEIRARSRTLEQFAFAEHRDMQLTGTGEPMRVFAARVTASFFPLLGVKASLGRTLLHEENQPGRTPVVVLSDRFWRSRMGATPNAVGRTLRLDGQPAVVIGVLPPAFHFDYPTLHIQEPVDLYVSYPLNQAAALRPSNSGKGEPVRVLAHLRAGVTNAQAEAELQSIGRALVRENPKIYTHPPGEPNRFTFTVIPLRTAIVGTESSLLWLLIGGAGVLLLIACANTAQLLLARSLQRAKEVAIRSALGATRARLIRQFLLEGLVLAAVGGVAGLLLACWIARLLVAVLPTQSPLLASAHLDARAIAFTLAISMLSALAFAVIPAVKGSRYVSGPSREGNRWRHAMIALEAALSVFLLCGAGIVAQNLWTLIATPTGFDPGHVLAMQLKLPSGLAENFIDPNAGRAFQQYLDKIAAIPGVESAATVTGPPLRPARTGNSSLVGVRDATGELKIVWSDVHLVSPGYFQTLRIPLLAGRTFRRDDAGHQATVMVVNEEFARQFGLGRDVVGKRLDDGPGKNGVENTIEIVGMVGNVRTRGLQTAPYPEAYLSSLQLDWTNVYLVVRSAIPPAQLVNMVKAAIQTSNPGQAVFGVMTMQEMLADSERQPRFHVYLIGAFALLAVAMAAAGMYSVISCLVSQRTSEIAIRIALGATRAAIVKTVLGTTSAWVIAGLACGLGLGLATRNTIRALSSTAVEGSPRIYFAVVAFFLAVTLIAAYLPLSRAVRLDPAVALRAE